MSRSLDPVPGAGVSALAAKLAYEKYGNQRGIKAELARRSGDTPARERWRQILSNQNFRGEPGAVSDWLDRDTLRGMARALGCSVWALVRANARDLGIVPPSEELPPGFELMPERWDTDASGPEWRALSRIAGVLLELDPTDQGALVDMAEALASSRGRRPVPVPRTRDVRHVDS